MATNNVNENEFFSADESIDVTKIMEEIQIKIKEKKDAGILKQKEIDEIEEMELLPLPDFLEIPNVFEPHLYPDHKKKNFEPLYFEAAVESGFKKKIMGKIRKLLFPFIRFMVRPIYNELRNLIVDCYNKNGGEIFDLKPLVPIVFQSKEYIKLLHNTINNTIVESSKLKIEEELLKTKIKVLEDKLEFLENRERALEQKVFK